MDAYTMRCLIAILVIAGFCVAALAQAQPWPAKPIRLIVPNAPGGSSDILARVLGVELSKSLGQQAVVENRPGANGNIGAELVARAAPDGYTFLLMDISNLAISPSLFSKLSFDVLRDFAPVTTLTYSPHLLAAHPSVPVKNVKELIAFAKARPGKLNVPVGGGLGGAPHLASMLFAQRTGIDWVYIPAPGGGVRPVLTGEGDVLILGMLQTLPHVQSGRLKLLAVSSAQRDAALPDTPTIAETPGLEGFVTGSWQGLLAPPNTPAEIINRMNAEAARIFNSLQLRERLAAQGTRPQNNAPAEMAQWLAAEKERWAKLIKTTGFKLE